MVLLKIKAGILYLYAASVKLSLTMHFHLNAVRRVWNIVCNSIEHLDVAGISKYTLAVLRCLVSVAANEFMNNSDQVFLVTWLRV
jgi:hypothetical protein